MDKEQKQDDYISLQEATKYCSHSQEYLSLRARQGKLRAVKLGRNWAIKREWLEEYITQVEEYNKANYYISLQEATRYCNYSQVYLSLRACQGKLKAVKLGRNWVIKREWLEEYLSRVKDYNNNLNKKRKKETKKAEDGFPCLKKVKVVSKVPRNLPIGDVKLIPVCPFSFRLSEFFKKAVVLPSFRFGFAWAMTLVLIIAGGVFGRASLKVTADDIAKVISSAEEKISEDEIYSVAVYETANVFKNYFKWVEQNPAVKTIEKNVKFVWQNSKNGYVAVDRFLNEKYIVFDETIFDSWDKLTDSAEKIVYRIKDGYFAFVDGFEKIARAIVPTFSRTKEFVLNLFKPSEIVLEKELVPESAEDGLVVIPSTERDEEIKIKIKESFSDEVEVEQVDKTSGTITPVFREREGGKYMYILVPVKN